MSVDTARDGRRFGIRSTRVVGTERVGPATVLIDDGRITAVVEGNVDAVEIVDCGALVLSPGIVDCHVHVNEPGRTEWEGFATATHAAAAGGVTTLVDMPLNSEPVTTDGPALEAKLAACAGQCFVDVGFWGGVVPGNASALPELCERGGPRLQGISRAFRHRFVPTRDRAGFALGHARAEGSGAAALGACGARSGRAPHPSTAPSTGTTSRRVRRRGRTRRSSC